MNKFRPETPSHFAVLDDNFDVRFLMRYMIESMDHQVSTFEDPEQLLSRLNGQPVYQGIFTDYDLGGAINGVLVARRAREQEYCGPITLVTGRGGIETLKRGVDNQDILQAYQEGLFTDVIAKPFRPADIRSALARMLSIKS